jgi:hypothetical protein
MAELTEQQLSQLKEALELRSAELRDELQLETSCAVFT